MYSKSYATGFEPASTLRINPNAGVSYRNNQPSTIPVRSFSDSSAYEAFNNIGKKQENVILREEKEQEIKDKSDEVMNKENRDEENEKTSVIEAFSDNRGTISSIIGGFSKIRSFFDFDVIILAVLIAVIFFNKETNDRLTPIALLAIMFL